MKLSVVIPVYNEAAVLPELVRRVRAAVVACVGEGEGEAIVVDDGSHDGTRALAATLSDTVVRFLRLDPNRGQIGATLEGIAQATGEVLVVLDGDLQDPPEHIPVLYGTLVARSDVDVVFAVKRARHDAALFRGAVALYHALQRGFAAFPVPVGAGSYCAFRARLRGPLLAAPRSRANLATLLAALRSPSAQVPYVKAARAQGSSRVGGWGLCREAIDSLAATGALTRVVGAASLALLALVAVAARSWWLPGIGVSALGGGVSCLLARGYERRRAPTAPWMLR